MHLPRFFRIQRDFRYLYRTKPAPSDAVSGLPARYIYKEPILKAVRFSF